MMSYSTRLWTIMNRKVAQTILTVVMLLFAAIGTVSGSYTHESLFVSVYADGRVDVAYVVLVDPTLAKVEIPSLERSMKTCL